MIQNFILACPSALIVSLPSMLEQQRHKSGLMRTPQQTKCVTAAGWALLAVLVHQMPTRSHLYTGSQMVCGCPVWLSVKSMRVSLSLIVRIKWRKNPIARSSSLVCPWKAGSVGARSKMTNVTILSVSRALPDTFSDYKMEVKKSRREKVKESSKDHL